MWVPREECLDGGTQMGDAGGGELLWGCPQRGDPVWDFWIGAHKLRCLGGGCADKGTQIGELRWGYPYRDAHAGVTQ